MIKKTLTMEIARVKPKFHQYELQIYIKNPTFLGMGNYEPTTILNHLVMAHRLNYQPSCNLASTIYYIKLHFCPQLLLHHQLG